MTQRPIRISALTPYPIEGASTRFRVAQFTQPLRNFGCSLEVIPFYPSSTLSILYNSGRAIRKSRVLLSALRRRRAFLKSMGNSDLVLVHRELAPVLPGYFERLLRDSGLPWVFDFDDAIFLPPRGGHPLLGALRRPREATAALVRGAAAVLAGNLYLAEFAREALRGAGGRQSQGPEAVLVLPTVVDTAEFSPCPEVAGRRKVAGSGDELVVGWIGTHTTISYLEPILPEIMALQGELPFTLRVVGGRPPEVPSGLRMEYVPWELEDELSYFRGLDVGLYPLVEDDWSRGKCGFKAIQYLSCGVPVVASPVGVIRDIVVHGETGFWAQSKGSWRDQLRILLTDGSLRRTLGERGRKKVEEEYSVGAVVPTLARTLLRAAGR